MSDVQDFAAFLNMIKPDADRMAWRGIREDRREKLVRGEQYFGYLDGDAFIMPATLPMDARMMLTRMWGGFSMLKAIIEGRVVPCAGQGVRFEWGDSEKTQAPIPGPMPVANPEGIRAETKIDAFVRRLNESPKKLESGPFVVRRWRHVHDVCSGESIICIVGDRDFWIASDLGPDVDAWLRETWRSLDAPPAIPPRVQRFLDALAEYEIGFKDDFGYTVEAPFTVTPPRSSGILITLGNGVEFGEINGDHFVADTSMEPTMRATLEHIWRETIRVEAMINKIAALEAELAAKTARLDQIAALLKANP